MILDRRQLALPVLAIGLLGVVPAFAASDEDAVAQSVEAFRAAQIALDAKALDALCAPELSLRARTLSRSRGESPLATR